MVERFAFETGEEINLLLDEAVLENTKKSLHTLLGFFFIFDGILILTTECSNTQACCEISHGFNYRFHSVQQSFAKRRKVVSHCHSRIFIISLQQCERMKQ